MRQLVYKNAFKKHYKLMIKRNNDIKKIDEIIIILANDLPILPSYKDHPLQGVFSGCRELHIEPDWLLVYRKIDLKEYENGLLVLEATGTHADLF